MKIVLLFLLLIFPTSVGLFASQNLKKRQAELKSVRDDLVLLKEEIVFTKAPLYKAAERLSRERNCFFFFLADTQKDVFMSYTAYRQNERPFGSLKEEDWAVLDDFFSRIGKQDIEGQKSLFERVFSRLALLIEDAERSVAERGRLYATSGFLIGLLFVIILA